MGGGGEKGWLEVLGYRVIREGRINKFYKKCFRLPWGISAIVYCSSLALGTSLLEMVEGK